MNRIQKVRKFITVLADEKITLALAESMTCGLASHQLSTTKDTSEVLKGSIVCYTTEVKSRTLGVPAGLIERHTAESAEVTAALAENLGKLISADVCAAVTGLAAAGGSETKSKPVGTVFFSVRYGGKTYNARKRYLDTPLGVRHKAVAGLYDFILEVIRKSK